MSVAQPAATASPATYRVTLLTVLWGLALAFAGRIAFSSPSDAPPAAWMLVFMALGPALLPPKYILASLLALIVYCDQSLWFLGANVITQTVYERDVLLIKPPELLLLVAFGRALFQPAPEVPRALVWVAGGWIAATAIGILVAASNGIPFSDYFIFSEFRTAWAFVLTLFVLLAFGGGNLGFVARYLCIAMGLKIGISFASQLLEFPLLWLDSASRYEGTLTAFFGADESVKVALLAFAFGWALLTAREAKGGWGQALIAVVVAAAGLAILASMRRGGVVGAAVVLVVIFLYSSPRARLAIAGTVTAAGVALWAAAVMRGADLGALGGAFERLAGSRQAAGSDWGRQMDVQQTWEVVKEAPVLGAGPGARLSLLRTHTYGVSSSLVAHQNVLHTWVKFGLLGVAVFLGTFLASAVAFVRNVGGLPRGSLERNLAVASMAYLASEFLWSLFTPPFFFNYRHAAAVAIAMTTLFVCLQGARGRQAVSAGRSPGAGNTSRTRPAGLPSGIRPQTSRER